MCWVYLRIGQGVGNYIYTVGFYSPDNKWTPIKDCKDEDLAQKWCHYLNGGQDWRK